MDLTTSRRILLTLVWPQFLCALRKRRRRLWRRRNAAAISQYKREYRALHKHDISAKDRLYRQRNREHIKQQRREYKRRNAAQIAAKMQQYRKSHRPQINARKRYRLKTDTKFRLAHSLRRRISNAMSGFSKSAPTLKLLGCSLDALRAHLEQQFVDGMSWENRSEWHIDHIRPVASFDLQDPAQQRACFHYSNMQPLWARDNLQKGARWSPAPNLA